MYLQSQLKLYSQARSFVITQDDKFRYMIVTKAFITLIQSKSVSLSILRKSVYHYIRIIRIKNTQNS